MGGRADKCRIEQLELQVKRLEADQATRDEFVAMVSHELRTPLTSIGGFSTTMLETWDSLTDGEKRRYLGIICAQSERLARLVAGLLTVARMDSGAFETRVEQVRVRDVIEAVGREVGEDRVVIECASDLMVLADRDHVAQVIDAGEGIPDAFVPHLFERFLMNHGREMGGTGLGLNIVRVLAEAQGGRAWYEPSAPHGSCFAVSPRRFFA